MSGEKYKKRFQFSAARRGQLIYIDLTTSIYRVVGAAYELCNNMPAVPGGTV